MGNTLTIDSTPSELAEIINIDAGVVERTQMKFQIPESINFHLKADLFDSDVAVIAD